MVRKYRRQTRFRSRLSRKEEKRRQKQAIMLFLLSGVIILFLVIYGISSLTKFAIFLTNIRGADKPIEILDKTPPLVPRLSNLPEETNKPVISIAGFAEPGSTVKIAKGELIISETLATTEGKFKIANIRLENGDNTFSVWATDLAGNDSLNKAVVSVFLDTEPPILEVSQPEDGASISGENEQLLEIKGRTEPGVDLRVNDRFIILDKDGNFTHKYPLTMGDNELKFVAKDKAGNETTTSLSVSYAK